MHFILDIHEYLCIMKSSHKTVRSPAPRGTTQEGRTKMKTMKKLWILMGTLAATLLLCVISASACTMVYVGSDLTSDGSSFLARSEDYANSYNKIAYVNQHGKYKAGDVYTGCEGYKTFTYTFTHDSYAYTATSDDNPSGVCPDCDAEYPHTPMEEVGTNEKGVSVSATVTLSGKRAASSADPMVSGGVAESDVTTVLLSEASSAKEGVELLLKLYDQVGPGDKSGIMIADQNESWYVENFTGHTYIAVKLGSNMIVINPNMGAIGLVDLDDTENVIASANLISVAKQAGTYVGDESENTIDVYASYCGSSSANARLVNGINYFLNGGTETSDSLSSSDYTISNVKDGKIVSMYTNIQNKLGKIGIQNVVDFYKVSGIANTGNLEWHIFQIQSSGAMETGTIEWLAMENGQYSVAIPYFPVLTTDMYEGYKFGGEGTTFTTTKPETMYGAYPSVKRGVSGYTVLPEGWENGYYWTVDALSNYALSGLCSDADKTLIHSELAKMQQVCYDKALEMKTALAGMSGDAAKTYATAQSAALAKQAHELTLELYKHVVSGEHTYGDWEVTTAPTCKAEGVATQTCKFCDATQTKNLEKSNEHSWDEGVVTKAATTTETGEKTYTCTMCQATKTEVIPVAAATPAGGSTTPATGSAPQTGDSTNITWMVAAMLLSMTGAAWVLKKKIWVK